MKLSARQKLELIQKARKGVKVAPLCRQFGVSRFTFYKYLGRFKRNPRLLALTDQRQKGSQHWKGASKRKEKAVLEVALGHPAWSTHQISRFLTAKGLRISNHGIQGILERKGLNRQEKRLAYQKRQNFITPKTPVEKFTPEEKLQIILAFEKERQKVASICRKYGLSRYTFYKWQKRFKEAPQRWQEALLSQKAKGKNHWRFISEEKEKLILNLVTTYPEYSVHKLAAALGGKIGHHGIQNILLRNGLNIYQKRLAFAKLAAPVSVFPPLAWLNRLKLVWETFIPQLAPAPPPKIRELAKIFSTTFVSSSILFLLLLSWFQIFSDQTFFNKIGLSFASLSLAVGTFFFLYSMKYYFTLTLVLGFSRQISGNGPSADSGLTENNQKLTPKPYTLNPKSWWQRIFGPSAGSGLTGNGNGSLGGPTSLKSSTEVGPPKAGGLQPNLDHIKLEREPFVSIHLPLYNEKRVVNRLLTAATSMDYENYEVVVVDDSTDETTQILENWKKHPRVKVVHRPSRAGFKGGALQTALEASSPKTEFVMVFDADFIPYPDTITQFLKYFQSVAGTLDFSLAKIPERSDLPGGRTSEGNSIAAVQGYQWHVLNKSENWITRGVRSEYAGSYVVERSGGEILGALKQIAGSVYMIRADLLKKYGWGTSITEDFELTLKLYRDGWKVVYTPYVQGPAECVSTIKRLIRQRMRWAEGHSHNIRKMFGQLMVGRWEAISCRGPTSLKSSTEVGPQKGKVWVPSKLNLMEKLEFLYLSPYYLQAAFFILGTLSWFLAEAVFRTRLPFWTSLWGWSLVLTNLFALPLMNTVGLFLEESEEKDYLGIFFFLALSYILAPFQAYAAVKGFIESQEGPWFRTPKTGKITDIFTRGRFYRFIWGIFGRPSPFGQAQGYGAASRPNFAPAGASLGRPAFAPAAQALGTNPLNPSAYTLYPNPYLSLAPSASLGAGTANNQFNNFQIRRKRWKWTGKSVLALLLIGTILLNYLAFWAPSAVQAQELDPTVEQQINIISRAYTNASTTDAPTDNSLGLVRWTAASYTGATVYFEAVVAAGESVVTTTATLYDSAGSAVSGSAVSQAGTSWGRVRSNAISLTDGTDYTVRIKTSNSGYAAYIRAARLIIVQSVAEGSSIANTETQIEVGHAEGTSNTSYATLNRPKIYNYDSSKFTPTPTPYFEATLRAAKPKLEQQINIISQAYTTTGTTDAPTDNSLGLVRWTAASYTGATVYFEAVVVAGESVVTTTATLYDSAGSAVSGSAVSQTGIYWGRVRSNAISLVDGTDYTVRIKTSNAGYAAYIRAARLIIVQSDNTKITNTETQVEVGNAEGTSNTSYITIDRKKIYNYDSSKFSPSPTAYFEASLRAASPKLEQQINIVSQAYNTTSTTDAPTDNSLGLVRWTAASYTGATVYFEAVVAAGASVVTTTATLYNSAGSAVSGSAVSQTGTSLGRVRSNAISLVDGTDYTVRIKTSSASYAAYIRAARLIIVQSDATKITNTETQIEVGNNETSTATTDTQLTNKKIYNYDSTKFSPAPTVYFEATLSNDTAGSTAYASLYTDGASCTTQVSGSEVSVTGTTWTRTRSSSITLSSGTDYMVCVRASANTAKIANAKISLVQSDTNGITAVETVQQYVNILLTDADTGYTSMNRLNEFNLSNFGVFPVAYFEATLKTSAGTGYAQLLNSAASWAITGSEVTTTSTSYTRVRSGDVILNLPQSATNMDTQLKNSASNTTSASSSWLILQISNLPTSGGTGYAELFECSDSTCSTGSSVASSEVSTTNAALTRVRSSSITLTTGRDYVVRVKSAVITNAKIVLGQADANGITALETVQQYINTLSTRATTTYTDREYLNQFNLSTFGVYPTAYFEATLKTSAGTGYAQIVNDTAGWVITDSEISTTSTSYTRVRSGDISLNLPQIAVNIDTQLKNSATNTTSAASSWLILQISNLPTSGGTGYVELYNQTDTTSVTGSEVSSTNADFTRVRSSSITLTTAKDYVVRVQSAILANAKIVLIQADATGITALETVQQYINTLSTQATSTYTDKDFLNQFDPVNSFIGGTFTYYFEATLKTSAGTGYARLKNDTDGTAITGSEVSTVNTSYTRLRSGDITANMPTAAKNMDTQLKNSATNTTSAANSWLIVQVSGLAVPEKILFLIPFIIFLPKIVRWWRRRRGKPCLLP